MSRPWVVTLPAPAFIWPDDHLCIFFEWNLIYKPVYIVPRMIFTLNHGYDTSDFIPATSFIPFSVIYSYSQIIEQYLVISDDVEFFGQ